MSKQVKAFAATVHAEKRRENAMGLFLENWVD
jgi:hypothetical protein